MRTGVDKLSEDIEVVVIGITEIPDDGWACQAVSQAFVNFRSSGICAILAPDTAVIFGGKRE